MKVKDEKKNAARPPVVAVMGHIDHGKSTLLDYIRKTNIVEEEAGGITQKISAYEVVHKDEKGEDRKITFLDTPGHEAFSKMRERGALIADIAILVVSAEDGVKPQTVEAWKTIVEAKIPCIVAINKIDKPGANVEKTKTQLAENEIYLENFGGKVPFAEISAKAGTGVGELLTLILIMSDLEEFTGDLSLNASGFVIEVNMDPRRGTLATLIIKNGTLRKGMTVAVEDSLCSTRIMENFLGKMVDSATFSSPVRIVGFDKMPSVGARFESFEKKSAAEEYAQDWREKNPFKATGANRRGADEAEKKIIPIILKADLFGSIEAIEKEIAKIKNDNAEFKVVGSGIGSVSLSDIKEVSSGASAVVIGFNVGVDKSAADLAAQRGVTISSFNIIYELTEWLAGQMEERRPRVETQEITGRAKIIRAFSRTKERQIIGGKVLTGVITLGSTVKIMRRDFEIGRGKIVNLEKTKNKVSSVEEGTEFGMMIESKTEIVAGDVLEAFSIVQK